MEDNLKRNKFKASAVSSRLILPVVIILATITILTGVVVLNSEIISRYSSLINDSGRIRGGIQRVIKRSLLGMECGSYYSAIDRSIDQIKNIQSYESVIYGSFRDSSIDRIEKDWNTLKGLLNRSVVSQEMIDIGERIWHDSDELVSYVESRTLTAVRLFYVITVVLAFVMFFLLYIIIYARYTLRDKVEYRANFDSLTGLFNRHFFLNHIQREYVVAERTGRTFALLILDIDHFKSINDTHGHSSGDVVLEQFASILKSSIREIDLAARFGGEEFIVFMFAKAPDEAVQFGERLRKKVEQFAFGENISVTVTVGISFYVNGCTFSSMFEKADKALYRGKEQGRNRVILSE